MNVNPALGKLQAFGQERDLDPISLVFFATSVGHAQFSYLTNKGAITITG
jgi:hypothetical protein